MKLQALGSDLAKNVFHLVDLDRNGHVVIRKRCSRRQVLAFTANVEVQVIGMEACSGAHFLGRALREQGQLDDLSAVQNTDQSSRFGLAVVGELKRSIFPARSRARCFCITIRASG